MMTPIPAVVTVDVSENVETALRRCVDSGHTRLRRDRGRQHRPHPGHRARELARAAADDRRRRTPRSSRSVKDALIVPETKPLDDLLADLQRERASMAVVVDEYGRTAGIVTVEDIIEEVVGEIADETDPAGGARAPAGQRRLVRARPRADHRPGRLRPRAAGRLGGLQLGRRLRVRRARAGCPSAATWSSANGYSLRVESVRENRIEAVRIRDHEAPRLTATRATLERRASPSATPRVTARPRQS